MTPTCPLCNDRTKSAFSTADWNLATSQERFEYFRCLRCGSVFIFPIPQDLGKYYPTNYPAYETHIDIQSQDSDPLVQEKLAIVRRHIATGRMLEIGPGSGGFLRAARDVGFDVEAVEMDERCCSYLNQAIGIPTIHTTDIFATLDTLPSYDVIVLWHVIEHLPDTSNVLEKLSNHLEADGILILSAPNPESLQFRFFGRYWVHLDAPRHLVLIPPSSLTRTASNLDLSTVSLSTKDEACRHFSSYGWFEASFRNARIGNIASKPARFRTLPRFIRILLFQAVFRPAENIPGLGSTYTVVFRKQTAA